MPMQQKEEEEEGERENGWCWFHGCFFGNLDVEKWVGVWVYL